MAAVWKIDDTLSVVAGLKWTVAANSMGRQEARSRARGDAATALVLRAGNKNLGVSTVVLKGAAKEQRLVSFAGALADRVGASAWCGVFEFEGKYAFIAATDSGAILADGDKLFDRESEAKARLQREHALGVEAYAPASWQFEGAKDSDELLQAVDWQSAEGLQTLKTGGEKRPVMVMLASGALLACGFVGYTLWQNHQAEIAAAELAKAPPPPPNPWISKPKPVSAVASCLAARAAMADLAHNGWALNKLECNAEARTFTASLNWFSADSVKPQLGAGATLKMKSDGSGIEIAGPLAQASSANRAGESANLPAALNARNTIIASTGAVAWQNSGNRSQFSFKVPANLEELAGRLNTVPTLSINRMEYSGGTWRVEGEVYN